MNVSVSLTCCISNDYTGAWRDFSATAERLVCDVYVLQLGRPSRFSRFQSREGPIPWSSLLYRTKYGWYTQFRALQYVT